ncbi:hypothetical protein [Duganella sp. Root198D2]|uniref:hypothetical protein n=1 Tax=Duganella sp. Root198D2 TaxID=1736489 RepID=UPI000ADB1C5D|nr:hypothetical protein [Duganella sp. Root198D2]
MQGIQKKSIIELKFVKGREAKPTLEVQAESLDAQGINLGVVVSKSLAEFAKTHPKCVATVYSYGTMSVNFFEQGWSEFLIVAGDIKALKALGAAFSQLINVKSRYSDYISPYEGQATYHVEDGRLWQVEDAVTWFSVDQEPVKDVAGTDAVVDDDFGKDEDEIDGPLFDDFLATLGESESNGDADNSPSSNGNRRRARMNAARSDASVAKIRQTIENLFGLPEGSVALCGPDGRALRGDALIKTLRRRWEEN